MRPRVPVLPRLAARAAGATLFAALAACASSPPPRQVLVDPNAGVPISTQIEAPTTSNAIRQATSPGSAVEASVATSAAKAFAALPEVYEALGLPVNTVVTDAGLFGTRDARAPRRVAKEPLSRYLECGAGATGAPYADTYAVTLTALSRVTPAGDTASVVATQVAASARPLSTSGGAVRCASNGRLEQVINAALVQRAAR